MGGTFIDTRRLRVRRIQRDYTVVAALAVLSILAGCAPDPGRTLVVTPASVEFGTGKLNESVQVAAPVSGAKLAIRAESDAPWLTIVPDRFFSDGPDNAAPIALSVARALMKPGRNTCRVTLKAAGHADTIVHVSADAIVSADFRASHVSAQPGELVLFNDSTRVLTGAEPVTAWKWDFGDGATSSEQNPVHAYQDAGVYTVTLAVTSASGSDVRVRANCVKIRVPSIPSADFVAATRHPVAGTEVQFSDVSVPGASKIATWLWDFGDGGSSAEQHPVHIYSAAAVYDVYLTVRNTNGTDTALKLGYIDVQPDRRR